MNAPPKLPRSGPIPAGTLTSRDFNQNSSKAKTLADRGPVIITDRGKPAYVLLSYEQYERLSAGPLSLLDALADPRPEADFDFDFERAPGRAREAEFESDD